jgi:phosphatidylglycerol:prolipoprotein diacylglycerol transferase
VNPWLWTSTVVAIPTYFACLMIGLAVATAVLRREALRRGIEPRVPMDVALWVLPASLIGARLAHVLVEGPDLVRDHPWAILSPGGGWVFYGGLAGALAAGWRASRRVGVGFLRLADLFAPATAFGLVFGRIGCLGGGCCYGRPADWPLGWEVPWSVRYFVRGQLPEPWLAVPLHPAPLYEALGCVALFVLLSLRAERQRFDGEILLGFLGGYGVWRSVVEVFRADAERGLWFGGWLSTSQIVGVSTALFALVTWRRMCTRSSSPSPGSTSTGTA